MEGTGLMEKLYLRGELREECCRNLRAIELSAYSELMNAMRASGELDDPKRELIDIMRRWFQIPDWRHQAEIRRVASDERLTLIGDTVANHYTTTGWLEEGYTIPNHSDCPIVSPILSNEALVLKVIERRLQEQGVDFKDEKEMLNVDDVKGSETKVKIPQLVDIRLQPEEPSIVSADQLLLERSTENGVLESEPLFASNMDVDNESTSESRSKRRRNSSELDRNFSPDITRMSAAESRKRIATENLRARLSYTSSPDLERSKQKLEREAIAKEREAAEAMEKFRIKEDNGGGRLSTEIIQDEERSKREVSTASTDSCLSTEARDEVRTLMVNKPPPKPTRGRGLARVRGRSVQPFSGRGRGRGRGKHQMSSAIPWPMEIPVQFPPPPPPPPEPLVSAEISLKSPSPKPKLGRGLKVKANGDEVKKRAPYRKKKPTFQPLSNDNNFNETPTVIFKENQNTSQEASPPQFRDQMKTGPSFEQQFLHGSNQYYDSFDNDTHPHGQDINPNLNMPRPLPLPHQHQQRHQQEIPPKVRHKTKHTIIIHDPHESMSPPKNTQNFVDYNESNLKHPPSIAPPPPPTMNSVIVRTPSISHPPNTPPKIINPHGIVKTHVSITQNQKPMVNYSSTQNRNVYERHNYVSPPPPPYRITPTTTSNNVTHKKRTQNLAAATTYSPQSDPMSFSPDGGNTSEVGQHQPQVSSTNATTTVGGTTSSVTVGVTTATASSLAVRSRSSPYDFKPPVSSTVTSTSTPLPALTSVVRMHPIPAQSNPNVAVLHQRKAQPHILATSKIHRSANVGVAGVTVNSGVPTTQGIPSSSIVTTNSTVIQSLTPGVVQLPSIQATSVTVPNFNMASTTNVVSLGKANIPLGPPTSVNLTRSPGTNIIFVPKNQNPNPAHPGTLSSGAVILRRANNAGSNLMILDIHKNNVMGRTPVVSHLLQGARLLNSPQVVNQASLSGSPIRKIIQTSTGKILTSSPTTIITSTSTSKSPVRTARIFTTQSSLGKATQVNIFPSAFKAPNLQKPVIAIRPVEPNIVHPTTIEAKEINCSPYPGKSVEEKHSGSIVSSSLNVNKVSVFSHSNISLDKSNTCDINTSLLSDEVMDNSPPPAEEVEVESFRVETTNKGHSPASSYPITTTPSKTIISVVSEPHESSNVSSILNRVLRANRPIMNQRQMEVDNEDEFEEDEEDLNNICRNSATSSQSSSLVEDEEEPDAEAEESEDAQNEDEDESEEDEGEIELIDLADDEPTESEISTQTFFQPQVSETTEIKTANMDSVLCNASDEKCEKDNLKL